MTAGEAAHRFRRRQEWPWYALAALLLSWVALYNGYPLVYSDSGTYVDSSFGLKVPLDRPGFYGVVLLAAHWKLSLWLPVLVQSTLVVFLIDTTLGCLVESHGRRGLVLVVLALAVGTSLPWFTGQLMPDVFAGVLVLSLFLLLWCADDLHGRRRLAVEVLAVVSILVHFSHIALGFGLVLGSAAWSALRRPQPPIVLGRALRCLVCAMLISVVYNFARTGEAFVFSRVSHVFLTGRLVKDGLIQRLLDDHCSDRAYALCPFRDRIVADSDHWVWSPDSPLQAIGGFVGSREESRRLIVDSVVAYPGAQLAAALRATGAQLLRFRTGDGLGGYGDDTWVAKVVQRRFPAEASAYSASRQQRGTLWGEAQRVADVHQAIILVCLVLSPVLAALDARRGRGRLASLHVFLWLALLLNAGITGVLSTIADRYGARIIWLLPFVVLLSAWSATRDLLRSRRSPSERRSSLG